MRQLFQTSTTGKNPIRFFCHGIGHDVSSKHLRLIFYSRFIQCLDRCQSCSDHQSSVNPTTSRDYSLFIYQYDFSSNNPSSPLSLIFVGEYVTCKTCHSPDTLMKKEERLTMVRCNACHSQYSVSSIRTGFQAQIGRRSQQTWEILGSFFLSFIQNSLSLDRSIWQEWSRGIQFRSSSGWEHHSHRQLSNQFHRTNAETRQK